MKHKIGIYKITSPIGRVYIGQSINIFGRFARYRKADCKKQLRLLYSLLKHGPDKHEFEILLECKKEELDASEIYYINLYKCFGTEHGLNLREGGRHAKPSEETKKIIKEKRVVRPCSEETKRKISESNKGNPGHKQTEETKNRIGKLNSKINWTKDRLEKHNRKLELYKMGVIKKVFLVPARRNNAVAVIRKLNGKTIKRYISVSEAARDTGCSGRSIMQRINKKIKTKRKNIGEWELAPA